ncbi:MAG TPA: hypothetical protein VJQ53_02825, partial [Candidatus Eisenbacteria bacterium]|nr:hypothetical protein [Candidatus Eisenbacteria bacterium]
MRLQGAAAAVSAGLCCAFGLAVPSLGPAAAGGFAAVGPVPAAGSSPEPASETYWLPIPVEEIEAPEALDDAPGDASGFFMRATVQDGVAAIRRVSAARSGRSRIVELSLLGDGSAARAGTLAIRGARSGFELVAGRVRTSGTAPLFLEAAGLSRRASRVPRASADAPRLEPPTSASSPSIEGIGFHRSRRPGAMVPGLWIVAGRRFEDGTRIGAIGLGSALAHGSWSVAAGTIGGAATGAITAEVRSTGTAAALEVAAARGGAATLLSVERVAGPLRLRGRWRHRAGESRPAACELSVEGGPRAARARIHASGGPSGPSGSIGRMELECRLAPRGLVPIALRAGRSRTDGFSAVSGATVRTERYAVLDASIARSAGRGFALLATRRERQTLEGTRLGSSLGGRIDLTWRRRGRLEVFVEAARADLSGGAA